MSDEPIIVATYPYPMAAHLARIQLESEGIRAFVLDENEPMLSHVTSGIKVMVSQADSAAARLTLGPKAAASVAMSCPNCGSTRITEHHAGRRFAFLDLLLGIPFGRSRSKARCEDCLYTWRQ